MPISPSATVRSLCKRPLGVCSVRGGDITLCYQLKGEGTHMIAQAKAGDRLSVLLPLGNGFDLGDAEKVAVIGGGRGHLSACRRR